MNRSCQIGFLNLTINLLEELRDAGEESYNIYNMALLDLGTVVMYNEMFIGKK